MRGKLPPLQPGKEWALKIYPDGRSELRQVSSELIATNEDGIAALRSGRATIVRMMDISVDLVDYIKNPKGTQP